MRKPNLIIGKKHIILACLTLILGVAVYMNYAFASVEDDINYNALYRRIIYLFYQRLLLRTLIYYHIAVFCLRGSSFYRFGVNILLRGAYRKRTTSPLKRQWLTLQIPEASKRQTTATRHSSVPRENVYLLYQIFLKETTT